MLKSMFFIISMGFTLIMTQILKTFHVPSRRRVQEAVRALGETSRDESSKDVRPC